MPLKAPDLDTRRFDELVEEARLRIVRYNPEWTDFNESDPGITLVQLFAWLTEQMLYQMNQVPELNYIRFLQMLNLELEPARAARARLTFHPALEAQADRVQIESVPPRTSVQADVAGAEEPLVFETVEGFDLTPWPLLSIQVFDGNQFQVITNTGIEAVPEFQPFGAVPQIGSALYLGFQPPEDEVLLENSDRIFPQQMRLSVTRPAVGEADVARGGADASPAPRLKLRWEYRRSAAEGDWLSLDLFGDSSHAFTRDGDILLQGPVALEPVRLGRVADPRFWLRCRLIEGEYPPAKVPLLDAVLPNTVEVENLTTVGEEFLGSSDGLPNQNFQLERTPVLAETLELQIVESADAEPQTWQRVADFLGSRDDDHFVLNANTGAIRFGDGQRGRIPPAGADIIAINYRYGGGDVGNVGPRTIITPGVNINGLDRVTNYRPAAGGRDEQTVNQLKLEAPRAIRSRGLAVSEDDFRHLALKAGGVAQAAVLPLVHPDFPGARVPGAVTVIVVPDTGTVPPIAPPELLRQVYAFLDARRLITTELFVRGPKFIRIEVECTVEADPIAAPDAVKRDVIRVLNRVLNPFSEEVRRADEANDRSSPLSARDTVPLRIGEDFHPTQLYDFIRNVDAVRVARRLVLSVDGRRREEPIDVPIEIPPDAMLFGGPPNITVRPFRPT